MEVHHLVALADGGAALDPDNCVAMCESCHVDHHRHEVDPERREWLDAVENWGSMGLHRPTRTTLEGGKGASHDPTEPDC